MAWPTIFTALLEGQDLGTTESAWAMDQIMSGEASPVQVAGFLMALRAKGETVDEMRGLADTMLAHASRITVENGIRRQQCTSTTDAMDSLGCPSHIGAS